LIPYVRSNVVPPTTDEIRICVHYTR
jgi:hypothetical protein